MMRTSVGVLRGGTSSAYGLSLKSGAAVLSALPHDSYDVRDILIDRKGLWHIRGLPATPARALSQLDVAINTLHGGMGEDGTAHRILERFGVPYIGSTTIPSAIALNKRRTKEVLRASGIRMPQSVTFTVTDPLTTRDMAHGAFARFAPPYIVKPVSESAAMGIRYAPTLVELPDAIGDVLDMFGAALVEEYIYGDEATVGVIEGFRGEDRYVLPPAYVIRDGKHLERRHHEEGSLKHHVPSRFSYNQKQTLSDLARVAHKALGLTHFSRSDFMVTPRHVYLLEVNTIPGFYPGAAFPEMLSAVGSSTREFLEHAISRVLSSR